MSYTSKDLAKELGISPATVSLVLNGRPGISAERRAQVLSLAEERGLITKNSGIDRIGFVVFKRSGKHVTNAHSPFYALLLDGAESEARANGYNLVMLQFDISQPREEQLQRIKEANCHGLIILATEAAQGNLADMERFNLPFVVVDNTLFSAAADTVCINNRMGIHTAFDYLYSLGHRRIGYLRSKADINSFAERYAVYQQCMAEKQLQVRSDYVIPLSYESNYNFDSEIMPFFNSEQFPTAFIADNDFVAIGAIRGFQDLGLRVPEDVSVIGFDNRDFGAVMRPALTSINIPTGHFGALTVSTLIRKIKEPTLPPTVCFVGTQLVVRESTAPVKK